MNGPEQLEGLEIGDRTSAFGSGGMRSKVVAAEMAAEAGIGAVICNGTLAGTLRGAAAGDAVGTAFARPGRQGLQLQALAQAREAHPWPRRRRRGGRPDAAGERLEPAAGRHRGRRGSFGAGDAIEVTSGEEVIGKGIADYSSEEVERIKGLKSSQVRELMPHAAEEAVHRDYFVLA